MAIFLMRVWSLTSNIRGTRSPSQVICVIHELIASTMDETVIDSKMFAYKQGFPWTIAFASENVDFKDLELITKGPCVLHYHSGCQVIL